MMRKQTKESVDEFYFNVDALSCVSETYLVDILQHISLSRSILEHVLLEDNRYCLDVTVSSLLRMVYHWSQKFQTKINVITDNSKQITASLDMITKMSNIVGEEKLVGYDTRKHIFPVPINSISMVDSNSKWGVQLADLIASSSFFMWSNTSSKYTKFQEELKSMPFSKLKGYSIRPATEDELSQEVDDSNDVSPIDFIIQSLGN